jgi:hypothetical protein
LNSKIKILESVVKEDLEDYFASIKALPDSQFGFRAGMSTTTALAAAHASWLEAGARSGVLGILAFDLSAAFDTVNRAQLIPKLHALGSKQCNGSNSFRKRTSTGRYSYIPIVCRVTDPFRRSESVV